MDKDIVKMLEIRLKEYENKFCFLYEIAIEKIANGDYMNLWQSKPQIHIKHGKVFFAQHYETIKIWLKSKERIML